MMILACFQPQIGEALFLPQVDSFFQWTDYISLALPSMVMVLFWTVSQEFAIVFAGVLGVNQLAAMTLLASIGLQMSMIGQAMSETLTMFVENLLSHDEAQMASKLIKVVNSIAVLTFAVLMASVALLRYPLADLFTTSPEIRNLMYDYIPLLAVYMFFNCLASVL
jgi:Na+-driven multidrug efflux pump